VERVGGQVLARHLERGRRALDRGDPARATGERRDREAAGVAEAVEHLAARGELAHALPVLALIEEEAGLLALLDVDAEVEPVLDDRAARRVAVAAREADAGGQRLELAHLGVGALEDRLRRGELRERVEDRVAPALDARGEELRHQHVRVAVDDQAGQAVGLAVHQAQRVGVAPCRQRLAQRERALDAPAEESRVHFLARVEGPHASADLRLRAVRGAPVRFPGSVLDLHRIARAGLARYLFDRAGEEPGMAPPQGLLAPLLEDEDAHLGAVFFRARGCAASYTFASAWKSRWV